MQTGGAYRSRTTRSILCSANSVIEHLSTYGNQQMLAAEIQRVGRAYLVQTPNRWFPLEPHYFTPFVHFLPKGIRRCLVRNITVWGWVNRPSAAEVNEMVEEIRLLDSKEMAALFPDSSLSSERFLGFKKALLATRRDDHIS